MQKKILNSIALILVFGLFTLMAIGSGSTGSGSSNTKEINNVADDPAEAVLISEQMLFEFEGLTVTATEFTADSIWGSGIKLLIENNSVKNLGVGCNALIVNNYMITDLFSANVAAGKKANETLYLSSSKLEDAGIENIGQIEIYFRVFDSETYSTLYDSDCVTIKTSNFEKMDITILDAGTELLNKDGIRIVGKYVNEDTIWGTAVVLYIENKTGKNIGINCDNMSVNGFMISPMFSSTIYANKMAVDDLTIFSSDLEENGIEIVKDIELTFHIYNANTYDTIFDSDIIKFTN